MQVNLNQLKLNQPAAIDSYGKISEPVVHGLHGACQTDVIGLKPAKPK